MLSLTDMHALITSQSSRLWSMCEASMFEFASATLTDPDATSDQVAIAHALTEPALRAKAFTLMVATQSLSNESTDMEVRAALANAIPAMGLALARLKAAQAVTGE